MAIGFLAGALTSERLPLFFLSFLPSTPEQPWLGGLRTLQSGYETEAGHCSY